MGTRGPSEAYWRYAAVSARARQRSRWAFLSSLLRKAEQLLELLPIKTYHRLTIDHGHRRGPKPQLHQFLERGLVRADIFGHKRNTVLRKKLFLSVTGPSPRLGVHDYVLRHRTLHTDERLTNSPAPRDTPQSRKALYEIGPVRSTNG